MLPYILCASASILAAALAVKLLLLKKDIDEIWQELGERLSDETNTLLSVSSRDKHIIALASKLNEQLRLLRAQRREYASGNQALKDAVTNISHDLRTPLTAIAGYLDLLEAEDGSPAAKKYISIIQNRSELLSQLTEELFFYSVTLTKEGGLCLKPVILNRVLEESIAAFYTEFQERGIVPDIQMPAAKVIRTADAAALSRIFSNILHNAIKYSGGDLRICFTEDGTLSFSNTADGLSDIEVGRLFDRFYTVEDARGATGLGLSIAKKLTEQMGGSIYAKYEEGRLSIFLQL